MNWLITFILYVLFIILKWKLQDILTLVKSCNSWRSKFCYIFSHINEELSIKYLQVLDFFNSHMDAQRENGDWSVNEVLQVITVNCRSWRGDGMKVRWNMVFWFVVCFLWRNIIRWIIVLVLRLYLFWQMFTQLRFTYEQESHPEEFFIPYVWQLVLSHWYDS